MAKQTKKQAEKKSKKRADKYDKKLKINGTFEELAKALINPKQPTKKK